MAVFFFSTKSFHLNTSSLLPIPSLSAHRLISLSTLRPPAIPGFRHRSTANSASPTSNTVPVSQHELGILLEVEGVLVDFHNEGIRHSFNEAFRKLGLDCANWTEPIYLDLVREGAGQEGRMLTLFFNGIGWPTSLPTNEKESFVRSVLKEKRSALEEYVRTKSLPLRPGAESLVDEALNMGVPLVFLTAYSKNGEEFARLVVEKLGVGTFSKVKIVGKEELEKSFYGQLILGKGVSSTLEEQLAREVTKAALAEKQRIAEEVAATLKLSVDIDTSSAETLQIVVAALRAGAEVINLPVDKCVLIAGSLSGAQGAEQIGMPCVVLRSRFTLRAEFPSTVTVMEGFGDADLTIHKLRAKKWM